MSKTATAVAEAPVTADLPTIADMQPGQAGYTTPWAMRYDQEHGKWLVGRYRLYPDPDPASNSVMRVEYRAGGFHVWPPEGHEYKPHSMPPRMVKFPVANVHDAPASARKGR